MRPNRKIMYRWLPAAFCVVATILPGLALAQSSGTLDVSKVIPLTRFLEDHPLDKQAPLVRAALVQWEADSKDVVDVICPGIFAPVPQKSIKYSSELLGQFIFGSAAHQLAVPGDKGKLMPNQLAGISSMLKAYHAFLAADMTARIPRFDELSRDEADGSLSKVLEPLVIANCLPKDAAKTRFPWTFGMSHKQVAGLDHYGPYRSFKNGDLETYNAVFAGHFENFQFFFNDDKLRRIGIYMYEGNDLNAAGVVWGQLHGDMQDELGNIETPGNVSPVAGNNTSMQAFVAKAETLVASGGKAQMAPIKQPADAYSFASFGSYEVQGTKTYFVTLFFDPPAPVVNHKLAAKQVTAR